jgi:NAD(P)-dependent dehydrogenase (short-subunit alcohol dehydrogenase family)
VVAGATRGAGRGIARALGEAGATVYCSGRSVKGRPSPYRRPETIEETAELITAGGGSAIAVRADHTVEREVAALFRRVHREHGRLDILVNSIAGEDPLLRQWCSFWKADLTKADAALRQSLVSHIITCKHAAPYMIARRRGLIVEVTESDILSAGGNPITQSVKLALKGLAFNMAPELRPHGVAAVAVTPGFLRSEAVLDYFGVNAENWREAGAKDSNFLESESPLFLGRGVAALAADPDVLSRSGLLLSSWELAWHYAITDVDGRRPDWGAVKMDFSMLPPDLLEQMRTGARIQRRWLADLQGRTERFLTQLPATAGRPPARARRRSPRTRTG